MKEKKNLITVPILNFVLAVILMVVLAYALYGWISSLEPAEQDNKKPSDSSKVETHTPSPSPSVNTQPSTTTNHTTNNTTTNNTTNNPPKEEKPSDGFIPGLIKALGGGDLKLGL